MKKTLSIGLVIVLAISLQAQVFFDKASYYGINQSYGIGFYGGGISFVDFNQDGWDDLTFATQQGDSLLFFLNNGDGFTKIPALVSLTAEAKQVLWVDYDNDGDKDLFVTCFMAPNKLYRNQGDLLMEDVSLEAGFGIDQAPTFGATFGDINLDGWLDVYVLNRDETSTFTNWLYLNNGDGTFTDITMTSGTSDGFKPSFTATFLDVNQDNWPDLYIANDYFTGNTLLTNNGDLSFLDRSISSGAGLEMEAMNVGPGDYDQDGDLDIYITNTVQQGNKLLRNEGNGFFSDVTATTGVACHKITWAANFFDCDNDLDLDLYVSSVLTGPGNHNVLYLNDGQGGFSEPWPNGFPGDDERSYANAIGDINNDGNLDIVVSQIAPFFFKLWENQSGMASNWLKIRLEGTTSNRDGIGSRVEVFLDGQKYLRTTHCGEGYLTQNAGTIHFGLGNNTLVDSIRIKWPSGIVDMLFEVDANQLIDITENSTVTNTVSSNAFSPLSLSPNPARAGQPIFFELKWDRVQKLQVEGFDLMGRKILRQEYPLSIGKNSLKMPLPDHYTGIVLLRFEINGQFWTARRIIIQ